MWFLSVTMYKVQFISYLHRLAKAKQSPSQVTTAMTVSNDTLTTYLEENPRMIGVLFTICLLLTQAGSTLAANGTTTS